MESFDRVNPEQHNDLSKLLLEKNPDLFEQIGRRMGDQKMIEQAEERWAKLDQDEADLFNEIEENKRKEAEANEKLRKQQEAEEKKLKKQQEAEEKKKKDDQEKLKKENEELVDLVKKQREEIKRLKK